MNVLVTGAGGFLGRNVLVRLTARKDCRISTFDRTHSMADLEAALATADIVFHLAGVNRPADVAEYQQVNSGLTGQICSVLQRLGRTPRIVFSSSIQAALDNPYGASKQKAEAVLRAFAAGTGASVRIFRLKNLFGKWCRPNYNSVTATFCHSIAHGLPVTISDPERELELSYVDDVVDAFLRELDSEPADMMEIPTYRIRLGDLADRICAFHRLRETLILPDVSAAFDRALYATYLSYVPTNALEDQLEVRSDPRGSLAEFMKSPHFGQMFVSRTRPGVTRGNHYHHTKTEKFLVVEGRAVIRMRPIEGGLVTEFSVDGREYKVVNIPPGFTHSITNTGTTDLVTLFWASEIFDASRADTHFMDVVPAADANAA